jgi:hypothetical protein
VFRRIGVVHIYDVIEHGRRLFRSLMYTSDCRFSLHEVYVIVFTGTNSNIYILFLLSSDQFTNELPLRCHNLLSSMVE